MKDIDKIIDNKKVNGETEETTAAVVYSYKIEDALAEGATKKEVKQRFNQLRKQNKFPSHLEFVDS